MLSNHPLENTKIEHFRHGLRFFNEEDFNLFEMGRDPGKLFATMKELFKTLSEHMWDDAVVQDLYSRRQEYDLIVTDSLFNEVSGKFSDLFIYNSYFPSEMNQSFLFMKKISHTNDTSILWVSLNLNFAHHKNKL